MRWRGATTSFSFAQRHKLKIGTIADLIEYRLRTEESVEIIGEIEVETEFGLFRLVCFEDHVNRAVHIALVRGKLDAERADARARAPARHA